MIAGQLHVIGCSDEFIHRPGGEGVADTEGLLAAAVLRAISRWHFPVPESPIRHSRVAAAHAVRGREGTDRAEVDVQVWS